jgi:glyoxalase superfamily protein
MEKRPMLVDRERGTVPGRESAGRMMPSAMTSRLVALCFDANDPLRLARFWADALHWEIDDETHDEIGLVPTDDTRFRIEFQAVPEHKAGKNRIHLDLTSTSIDDQKETVERLVELGARHIDVGQGEGYVFSDSSL